MVLSHAYLKKKHLDSCPGVSAAFAALALLLTIDGVPPQPLSAYSLFTPLEEATNIWTRLPARPNKLNHTGKIYG
jgi:hypothetical protein